jgi:hypothetical protein
MKCKDNFYEGGKRGISLQELINPLQFLLSIAGSELSAFLLCLCAVACSEPAEEWQFIFCVRDSSEKPGRRRTCSK